MIVFRHIDLVPAGKYPATIVGSLLQHAMEEEKRPAEWLGFDLDQEEGKSEREMHGVHFAKIAFRIDAGGYAGYVVPGFIDFDKAGNPNSWAKRLFRAVHMRDYEPNKTPLSWCHYRRLIITTRNVRVGGGVIPIACDYEPLNGDYGAAEFGFVDERQELFPFVSEITCELVRSLEEQGGPEVVVEKAASRRDLECAFRHTSIA